MKTIFSIVILSFIANVAAAQTLTFEALPIPAVGNYNGDPSLGSPYHDAFRAIGTRDNFGATELMQLWGIESVEFFNGYTPAFGSFNGFASSRVIDTTTQDFTNQYAAFPGGGSNGTGGVNVGEKYLIAFGNDSYFNLPTDKQIESLELTNTTWTALTLANGDAFAKKFGGSSGNDPDHFTVTFTGFAGLDRTGMTTGTTVFDLADFRFGDNSLDFIVDDWQRFDLTNLGTARSVGLSFFTTDSGAFGPNTPTYVAIDNLQLGTIAIPEPTCGSLLLLLGLSGLAIRRRR